MVGGRRVGKLVGLKGFLIDFHYNSDTTKLKRKLNIFRNLNGI